MKRIEKISCQKLESFPVSFKCKFCDTSTNDELKLGTIYKYGDIVVHYFCLLLSSSMEQNGEDEEGIYGFLAQDIEKEIIRGKRLRCKFCKKVGATLGCSIAKCKAVFHLPCGLQRGSLHQFYGQFKSFCVIHRPRQRINEDVLKKARLEPATCVICYDSIILNDDSTMWAPCCKKNAFFHRICVQKLANSFGGYAFRCPLCNDQNIFTKAMKDFGIFVPDRDASWEQEENAFNELLFRHNRCDAPKCICPHGRTYNKKASRWFIILCQLCGSQGIHHACRNTKSPEWECDNCLVMLHEAEKGSSSEGETHEELSVTSPLSFPDQHRNSVPLRRNNSLLNSTRSLDPCSSNNRSPALIASMQEIRNTVKKGKLSKPKSPSLSSASSRSSSASRSCSPPELRSRSSSGSHKLSPVRVEPRKLVKSISAASVQRSRSQNPTQRRPSSSSSSSVETISRPISPVIIIDSDDDDFEDVEVVADVSRNILVNRDGNKIQIVQIGAKEKEDKVEIQGDVKVNEVVVEFGLKSLENYNDKPEGNFKRRKTMSHLNIDLTDDRCKVSKISDNKINSAFKSSSSNVQQYNIDLVSNRSTNVSSVQKPCATFVSGRNFASELVVRKDEKFSTCTINSMEIFPERKYQVYTPPNRGNLQIKTSIVPDVSLVCDAGNLELEPDYLSRLPSHINIKIKDKSIGMKNQVGKSHTNDPAMCIHPSTFYSILQHSSNGASDLTYSCEQQFTNGESTVSRQQSAVDNQYHKFQQLQKTRFWDAYYKSRYNHFGLKLPKIVIPPIIIKEMKDGTVKVVQKKSMSVSTLSSVKRNKLVSSTNKFQPTIVNENNGNNSTNIFKTLFNKIVNNKSNKNNLLLKSVYNNMAIKNKKDEYDNGNSVNDNVLLANSNVLLKKNSKKRRKIQRKLKEGTENYLGQQKRVDEIFRPLFAHQKNKLITSSVTPGETKIQSRKRKKNGKDVNENYDAGQFKKRRKKQNPKSNECLTDTSNIILGSVKKKKTMIVNFYTCNKNNILKQNIANVGHNNGNSQSKNMKQTTLFDIFNSKKSIQNIEKNINDTNKQSLRERKDGNYNYKRPYKRFHLGEEIEKLRKLESIVMYRSETSDSAAAAALICNICKCNVLDNSKGKKLCCFVNFRKLSTENHNLPHVETESSNNNNDEKSKISQPLPLPSNKVFSNEENNKIGPCNNFIHVENINIIPIDKETNLISRLFKNNTINDIDKPLVPSNFFDNTKLVAAMDFPCYDFKSLSSPNCLKYTTFPLSKLLMNKILSSFARFEIKKTLLSDNKDCFQFCIFFNELPVLIIKVRLNERLNSVVNPHLNKMDANSCSHFTVFYNQGKFESFTTKTNITTSKSEKFVCYSFENEKSDVSVDEGCNFSVANNDDAIDDSFLVLPSLLSFGVSDANPSNVHVKLLMTVCENDENNLLPKNFTFQMKKSLKNDDTDTKTKKSKPRIFGHRRRRRRKSVDVDESSEITSTLTERDRAVPDYIPENNIKVLHEIQNKLPCSDLVEDTKESKPTSEEFELLKNNGLDLNQGEIKEENIKESILDDNVHSVATTSYESECMQKESFFRESNFDSLDKTASVVNNIENNEGFRRLDEVNGKFGFNIKEYEANFNKNLYKYIKTNHNCCSSGNNDVDCQLFYYINKLGDEYIKNTIGSKFKPSLFENKISSYKSSYL